MIYREEKSDAVWDVLLVADQFSNVQKPLPFGSTNCVLKIERMNLKKKTTHNSFSGASLGKNITHHPMKIRRNDEMIMIVMHTETELMNLYGLSFGIHSHVIYIYILQ